MTKPPFYITTPIYYVNDKPHIGHAYTTIACDTMARFKRLDGFDTYFLTGTDEHGMKIYQAAQKQGITPQELTDKVSMNFQDMNKMLNISNDKFIRTTDPEHKKAAQEIWRRMTKSGDIYLDTYKGWYSVRDEAFYGEKELTTDADGNKIAPTGAPCEWVEEESYFFKLSAWEDRLLKFYEDNPDFIQPASRRNEVISFVKGGLRDLCISRTTFDWGVPVPDAEKHVMYVWVDALTNYISALGFPDENAEDYKKFWPASIHLVGKDILRFHALYWPAFLMSAKLELPKMIYAHGWWMVEGQKMSKSLGNVISPEDMVKTYGLEQFRYFLLREVPFGNDGDFSHTSMVNRINAELANNIGNLVQRTLSMIAKNCDGKIPAHGTFEEADTALLGLVRGTLLDNMRAEFDKLHFHRAIEEIVKAANAANTYIDEQAPWKLKKENPERMATVLYVLAESIRNIALALQPFTPIACEKILGQIDVPTNARDFVCMTEEYALKAGTALPKPEGVFPRIMIEEAA